MKQSLIGAHKFCENHVSPDVEILDKVFLYGLKEKEFSCLN